MKYKTITGISIMLNIVFICGTILIAYKYYPKLKSKFFPEMISAIQDEEFKDTYRIPTIFYDASKFKIISKLPNTETYTRLPLISKSKVRRPVWELSQHSAGISIRFSSNSSLIKIRWKLKKNTNSSNMTPVASKGLDLYSYKNNKWQFVNVAKPTGAFQNEAIIIEGMQTINREYLLNLPLYDRIQSLEIGINKGASINKPNQKIIDTSHPIVFYGTSITQGASASRPGLTYPALLKRYFNKEVINLGFSGNGRFEKEIAKYIMTAKPSLIILDCTPNSPADTIRKNLPKTIDYITSVNDTVPIVIVESVIRDYAFFKKDDKKVNGTMSFIKEQNNALSDVYESKIKTRKNIFYINNKNIIGEDHEATIDGTHFNDLGHYRAYECFRKEIEKIINP